MSTQLSRFWKKQTWGTLPSHPRVVLLGSCFSTEMFTRMTSRRWQVLSNPMGTLFQPLVIADWIMESMGKSRFNSETDIAYHEQQAKCLMAGKVLNRDTAEEVWNEIQRVKKQLHESLSQSNILVVTFGTAYAWKYLPSSQYVGNCQRIQQDQFRRELIRIKEMQEKWIECIDQIKVNFPQLLIVFTVSPVRHEKLGVMENARSKANLLELCHRLCEDRGTLYFPSYEWITDELRDYAFYSTDGCHPSAAAVDFVFEKWIQTFQYEKD